MRSFGRSDLIAPDRIRPSHNLKIITTQQPPSCQNFTGLQSISELISKFLHLRSPCHYQSLAFGQPTYLSSALKPHQRQRSLCSVNQSLLSVPCCNSSFGQRSFFLYSGLFSVQFYTKTCSSKWICAVLKGSLCSSKMTWTIILCPLKHIKDSPFVV